MMLRGYNDLAELYTFAGIPDSCYDKKEAHEYGWQEYENEAGFGMSYVDFEMQEVQNKYLGKIYVINSIIPPYELEVDYGFEGCVEDRYFKAYDPDAAIDIAKNINGEPSEFSDIPYEIIVVNKDHLCFAPSIYTF